MSVEAWWEGTVICGIHAGVFNQAESTAGEHRVGFLFYTCGTIKNFEIVAMVFYWELTHARRIFTIVAGRAMKTNGMKGYEEMCREPIQ